jgi:hypothetical protein
MNLIKSLILSAALTAASVANAAILVTEPGADGFNIETLILNGSSYDITKITFDFSDTVADGSYIVIDGSPSSITAPAGGTATFFGSGAVFGFTFTSFNSFDGFKFKWDPDTADDGGFGAVALDFIGAKITAETTNGIYSGVFAQVGSTPDVAALLVPSPVPEPSTYALVVAGLAVAGAMTRRRKAG